MPKFKREPLMLSGEDVIRFVRLLVGLDPKPDFTPPDLLRGDIRIEETDYGFKAFVPDLDLSWLHAEAEDLSE